MHTTQSWTYKFDVVKLVKSRYWRITEAMLKVVFGTISWWQKRLEWKQSIFFYFSEGCSACSICIVLNMNASICRWIFFQINGVRSAFIFCHFSKPSLISHAITWFDAHVSKFESKMATKIMTPFWVFTSKIEQIDVEFDSQGSISVAENAQKNDHMV